MRAKLILLGALALCAALSQITPSVNPYYYDVLIGIGINIMLAAGLNLVNGYTGQFSLGHAGFMAVGAYLASAMSLAIQFPYIDWPDWSGPRWLWAPKGIWLLLAAPLRLLEWMHNSLVFLAHGLPAQAQFLCVLLYGGAAAALAGLVVGIPSLRLRGDYLAIVTLGFNEIIRGVIQNAEPLGAQRGLGGMMRHTDFLWTFGSAAVCVYVVLALVNSTYGRGFLAVRDDEVAAEAMGINTTKYKVLAFVIGAFFAGIAGGLYAHFKQYIHPDGFNFLRSVDIVVMVILGGMGNTAGVCVAAVILTILPEVLRRVGIENRMIPYSLLLIVLMLSRPQGLFGGLGVARKKGPAIAK